MALVFGGATSDRVTVTANATIDNLAAFTYLLWAFPTTLTNLRMFASKDNGAASAIFLALEGASGNNIQLQIGRGTQNAYAKSNDTPVTANVWICIMGVWDGTNAPRIYTGTLTSLLAERSYAVGNTAGSGAQNDDSGNNFLWGNDGTTLALQGRIAVGAIVNRALTLGEGRSWQYRPRVVSGTVNFFHLGYNGTGTQPDWSGNANSGAVTGATVGSHVPLGSPFGHDAGWMGAFTAAAAAAGGSFVIGEGRARVIH